MSKCFAFINHQEREKFFPSSSFSINNRSLMIDGDRCFGDIPTSSSDSDSTRETTTFLSSGFVFVSADCRSIAETLLFIFSSNLTEEYTMTSNNILSHASLLSFSLFPFLFPRLVLVGISLFFSSVDAIANEHVKQLSLNRRRFSSFFVLHGCF